MLHYLFYYYIVHDTYFTVSTLNLKIWKLSYGSFFLLLHYILTIILIHIMKIRCLLKTLIFSVYFKLDKKILVKYHKKYNILK